MPHKLIFWAICNRHARIFILAGSISTAAFLHFLLFILFFRIECDCCLRVFGRLKNGRSKKELKMAVEVPCSRSETRGNGQHGFFLIMNHYFWLEFGF